MLHESCPSWSNFRIKKKFLGTRCDIVNKCYVFGEGFADPCVNGLCQHSLVTGFAVCNCFDGWEGGSCEKDIDECLFSPCDSNHICSNTPGSWDCICPTGWEGETCETDIDECIYSPCDSNRICINLPARVPIFFNPYALNLFCTPAGKITSKMVF